MQGPTIHLGLVALLCTCSQALSLFDRLTNIIATRADPVVSLPRAVTVRNDDEAIALYGLFKRHNFPQRLASHRERSHPDVAHLADDESHARSNGPTVAVSIETSDSPSPARRAQGEDESIAAIHAQYEKRQYRRLIPRLSSDALALYLSRPITTPLFLRERLSLSFAFPSSTKDSSRPSTPPNRHSLTDRVASIHGLYGPRDSRLASEQHGRPQVAQSAEHLSRESLSGIQTQQSHSRLLSKMQGLKHLLNHVAASLALTGPVHTPAKTDAAYISQELAKLRSLISRLGLLLDLKSVLAKIKTMPLLSPHKVETSGRVWPHLPQEAPKRYYDSHGLKHLAPSSQNSDASTSLSTAHNLPVSTHPKKQNYQPPSTKSQQQHHPHFLVAPPASSHHKHSKSGTLHMFSPTLTPSHPHGVPLHYILSTATCIPLALESLCMATDLSSHLIRDFPHGFHPPMTIPLNDSEPDAMIETVALTLNDVEYHATMTLRLGALMRAQDFKNVVGLLHASLKDLYRTQTDGRGFGDVRIIGAWEGVAVEAQWTFYAIGEDGTPRAC